MEFEISQRFVSREDFELFRESVKKNYIHISKYEELKTNIVKILNNMVNRNEYDTLKKLFLDLIQETLDNNSECDFGGNDNILTPKDNSMK